MWSYNDSVKDDPYDPDAAKKLLAEAGFPERDGDRPLGHAGATALQSERTRIAELMQADLAKIGVKAEIKSFEWGEYRKRAQAASTRWRSSAGPATTAIRQFLHTLLAALRRSRVGLEHRQVLLQAVRRSRREGEDDQRPGRAHQALRAGAGHFQGAGALVHDRACGAVEADEQERWSTSS
jgi:hypothetical protein